MSGTPRSNSIAEQEESRRYRNQIALVSATSDVLKSFLVFDLLPFGDSAIAR